MNVNTDNVLVDDNTKIRRQGFNEGLATSLRNSGGKGRRLINLHIGSEAGSVENGLLLFEVKKTTNYYEEMSFIKCGYAIRQCRYCYG
ncbi:hypothetical protein Trydic_g19329 [Trypoxylus dichotomus]